MSKTFAIPDLHGRYDLMEKALAKLEGEYSGGHVVFLGDYIDRGPQSREIIERLMAGPKKDGWHWTCLKGNHEDMILGCVQSPGDLPWWIGNGGGATLASFGDSIPPAVAEWCSSLPMWRDDGKRIFVHAGVEPKRPMNEQGEAVLLWMRYEPRNADIRYPDRHIVHGHTPERDAPMLYPARTNLDGYAVGTGRLVIAEFDDDVEGGPVRTFDVRDA